MKQELLDKMPRHDVMAFKIKRMRYVSFWAVDPVEKGAPSITVSQAFVETYCPEVGGYVMVHPDGSKTYLPASAFEPEPEQEELI